MLRWWTQSFQSFPAYSLTARAAYMALEAKFEVKIVLTIDNFRHTETIKTWWFWGFCFFVFLFSLYPASLSLFCIEKYSPHMIGNLRGPIKSQPAILKKLSGP